jgi:hypothetical protein
VVVWFIAAAMISPLFSPTAHGQPLHVTCTFSKAALATLDDQHRVGITLDNQEPMEVTFKDIDTDRPRLSFSVGSSITRGGRLEVLRRETGLIWMAQSPEQGDVNYWTIFLKQKTALLSRHYAQDVTTVQRPVGLISMGRCE